MACTVGKCTQWRILKHPRDHCKNRHLGWRSSYPTLPVYSFYGGKLLTGQGPCLQGCLGPEGCTSPSQQGQVPHFWARQTESFVNLWQIKYSFNRIFPDYWSILGCQKLLPHISPLETEVSSLYWISSYSPIPCCGRDGTNVWWVKWKGLILFKNVSSVLSVTHTVQSFVIVLLSSPT